MPLSNKAPDPYQVYHLLKKHYGEAKPPLNFNTPEQLAVAVILSAQCTDERVNAVTPELFRRFPDMPALAKAKPKELEKLIYSTGFYRNKAANLKKLAQIVCQKYGGKLPANFDLLIQLPGIGRKTANVIMNQAFHQAPGIVVDTHVLRLAQRLGYSQSKNALRTEKDLMAIFPPQTWLDFSLYLIFHGRKYCLARRPKCPECFLNQLCPSALV